MALDTNLSNCIIPPSPSDKLIQLIRCLHAMDSVLVCYSGGVDSALVLAVAHLTLGKNAIGMTAVSPSLAPMEKENAVAVAKRLGADHRLVDSHELAQEAYRNNNPDRCFHCKSELYRIAHVKRKEWNLSHIVNGTNLDDMHDYRPGLEAAKKANVRSPLLECRFSKKEVRDVALEIGLSTWDKPASACLASRLPYGTAVTETRLEQIGSFEKALHAIGLSQVRVRYHVVSNSERPDKRSARSELAREPALARIEVQKNALQEALSRGEEIVNLGKKYGFLYVTLDLEGYRLGGLGQVIDQTSLDKKKSLPLL